MPADMLVMFAVAVGPTLVSVDVSTRDKLALLFNDTVVNGWFEGSPDVSSVVCTAPLVLDSGETIAVWTSEVVKDVNAVFGIVVRVAWVEAADVGEALLGRT